MILLTVSELGELVADLRVMAGAAGAGRVREAFLRRIGRQVTPVAAADRASSRNPHRSYVTPTDYCE
jgi:hypothetical protein